MLYLKSTNSPPHTRLSPTNIKLDVDESGIIKTPNSYLPKVTARKGKTLVGKIVPEDRGYLFNVCCLCSSGMFVAIGMMFSWERVCQEPCSEAKCIRRDVRRNLFDKTVFLMPSSCVQYVYQVPPEADWTQRCRYKKCWHESCKAYESSKFTCECFSA